MNQSAHHLLSAIRQSTGPGGGKGGTKMSRTGSYLVKELSKGAPVKEQDFGGCEEMEKMTRVLVVKKGSG